MKRLIIVAVVIALAASLAAAIGSHASAGKVGVLAGVWEAPDIEGTGNNLTMWLTQDGGHYDTLVYSNLAAYYCDPDAPANAFGEARFRGNVLSLTVEIWCLSNSPTYAYSFEWSVTYDPATDTMVDPIDGQTWHRR
jgi:hypothetical protein